MTSRATSLVIALVLLATRPLAGQRSGLREVQRVPVTVALVDELPVADVPFLVQRRPALAPHDIVLLRTGATAAQLSEAIRTLLAARQAGGDLPAVNGFVRMRPHAAPAANAAPRRQLPWAERVMRDVRKAPMMQIEGIGRGRAVQIWLPPQHGRRAPM
ncbi:MAG: hypothetical protein JWM27_1505 [Gemmatimonadetes bacterium]|nr:hypothetical protein [Gemmatimonadota bacterium]